MRKPIFVLLLGLLVPAVVSAAGGGVPLDSADVDLDNKGSLRNGARLYVNYCMGCHSLAYQRYNRLGRDLGIPDDLVEENLIFTADFSRKPEGELLKVGSLMTIAMPNDRAKAWFGTPPPDLTLIARSRGADWLYTYLRSFYVDPKRPFGANNTVFKDVGMPNVLWELEGLKTAKYQRLKGQDGKETKKFIDFEQIQPGKMTPAEFDSAVRDLVAFLVYVGEPAKLERYNIGLWVILFLIILFFPAYALKKEYWKDVH